MQRFNIPELEIGKKCPYRKMYEKIQRDGGLVSLDAFGNCKLCTGYGYFFNREKRNNSTCEDYEKIMQSREIIRRQRELIKIKSA